MKSVKPSNSKVSAAKSPQLNRELKPAVTTTRASANGSRGLAPKTSAAPAAPAVPSTKVRKAAATATVPPNPSAPTPSTPTPSTPVVTRSPVPAPAKPVAATRASAAKSGPSLVAERKSVPPAKPVVTTTTIEAKIDAGFGNTIYVRGQGGGLSWDHGIPLTCVDATTWRWVGTGGDKVTFKLLLNDAVWAQGEDVDAAPGQRLEVTPIF